MFVNNVTCLQQQQPLAIHYDRDHSHCISGKGRGYTSIIICTGYDVIIFCPYVRTYVTNVRMRTNLAGLIVARAA